MSAHGKQQQPASRTPAKLGLSQPASALQAAPDAASACLPGRCHTPGRAVPVSSRRQKPGRQPKLSQVVYPCPANVEAVCSQQRACIMCSMPQKQRACWSCTVCRGLFLVAGGTRMHCILRLRTVSRNVKLACRKQTQQAPNQGNGGGGGGAGRHAPHMARSPSCPRTSCLWAHARRGPRCSWAGRTAAAGTRSGRPWRRCPAAPPPRRQSRPATPQTSCTPWAPRRSPAGQACHKG
jgi:hypothetical protein